MRKRRRSILSLFCSVCLTVAITLTMLPQNLYAASSSASVKYVEDETGKRTGIDSIDLNGVTYYDIAQGKGGTEAVDGNQINFYKDVLTGEASDANRNQGYPGKSNQLNQWAELAEKIFSKNAYYSTDNADNIFNQYTYYDKEEDDSYFDELFGKRWGQAGYTDVSKALSSTSSEDIGTRHDNYTKVSGFKYSSSLSDVRQDTAGEIVDMVGQYAFTNDYNSDNDYLFKNTNGDNTMSALNDDTKQDVLYTRVTCLTKDQTLNNTFHYNTYVLAFYDFQLQPIAADGLNYITNAEGYGSVEAAADAHVSGVTYDNTKIDYGTVSVYENKAQEANNVSLALNNSSSETISTTLNSSQTFNYSSTLGWSVGINMTFSTLNKVFSTQLSGSVSGSTTTGKVLATATTKGDSITNSTSDNVTSSISLPAQTAATIESYSGKTNVALDYDCPVAVHYKVAMASMGGMICVYGEDSPWMYWTYPLRYKTFSTTFGSSSDDDSKDSSSGSLTTVGDTARTSLYDRTVTYRNTSGYEEEHSNTFGENKCVDTDLHLDETIKFIDWDKILGDTEEDDTLTQAEDSSENDYDDKNQVLDQKTMRSVVKWLGVNNPLSSTGGTLSYMTQNTISSVGSILPLYPLSVIRMDNNENIGDTIIKKSGNDSIVGSYVDANTLLNLTLYPGDQFITRNVSLSAFNENLVNYYGFKYSWGTWKPVKKDAEGNWVVDNSESKVASLKKDDATGNQYVEAGSEEGSYYIQYFINEDCYNSEANTDLYAKNETVKRPVIRFNVRKSPFEGKISLTGDYTGTVNGDSVNLAEKLNVLITDGNGNKIKKDIVWEAAQDKGISLTSDGDVTFQKAGTYQVRIYSEGVYSDWLDISAKNQAGGIQISGKFTSVIGDPAQNLDQYLDVAITDSSGKEIVQDYSWDVKELHGISVSKNGDVSATKAGSYHVRVVNADGQYSAWIAITAVNPAITLNKTSLTLTKGASASLTANVSPSNAKKQSVTWSSNNSKVSVSSNGVVTANETANAVISAKDAYGNTASCKVKVIAPVTVATLSKSGKAIKISWTKVAGASGYEIYGTYCDGKFKLQKTTSASVTTTKLRKMNGRKLKKSAYKLYVKAYKMVNGKKIYLSRSPIAHIQYKTSSKYANVKKITLTADKSLQVGNSVKLKAKVKIAKNRTQLKHESAIRYLSTDNSVATVTKNGKVTAKSVGTCYVYAMAVDGLSSKVMISVK